MGVLQLTGRAKAGWAIAVAVVVVGCGSSTEPVATGPDFDFAFTDPAGDTVAVDTPTVPALDAVSLEGSVSGSTVQIRIGFAGSITPWSKHQSNALDGYIDLDVDANIATGIASAVGDETGMGVDYYVDLRDNGSGQVALINTQTRMYTMVTVTFSDTQVTVEVPRQLIVDESVGFFVAAVVGTKDRPITDILPNEDHYVVQRPGAQ